MAEWKLKWKKNRSSCRYPATLFPGFLLTSCLSALLFISCTAGLPAKSATRSASSGGPAAYNSGSVDRGGYLGVEVGDVSPELARSCGLKSARGVVVSKVYDGTPAKRSGIRKYDIILAFDDISIPNCRHLVRRIKSSSPGSSVRLTIHRRGEILYVNATLGEHKSSRQAMSGPPPSKPVASTAGSQPVAASVPQEPVIAIHQVAIKPARVPPKAEFDLEVQYSVTDPTAASTEVQVSFVYKILVGSKTVFTSQPAVLDTPNGQRCIRTNHLKASTKKGNYSIQVALKYKKESVNRVAQFVIE